MTKNLILTITLCLLFTCSKNDNFKNSSLYGTWKLKEILADPGDGSGKFHKVESEKIIIFYKNGTVSSNGSVFDLSPATDHPSSGTFSLSDSTLYPLDPSSILFKTKFHHKGSELIISLPCDEPCGAKYIKQN